MSRPAVNPHRPLPWRSHPLLLAAATFALGVASAAFLDLPSGIWPVLYALAWAVGLVGHFVQRRRLVSLRPLTWSLALAVGLFAAGGSRMLSFSLVPPDHIAQIAREEPMVDLTGRVTTFPEARPSGIRFVLEADSVAAGPAGRGVNGEVLITLRPPADSTAAYPPLQPGDMVRLTGRMRLPPTLRNPADFDYGAFLHGRGLHATLALYDPAAVQPAGHRAGWKTRTLRAARTYVERGLRQTVHRESSRAILSALLLGDRSGLAETTRDQFARTGLMHLLAVSGLHVLLIGMIIYNVLKPLLTRGGWPWERVEVVRALVTMGVLGLYVLLVGAPASAVRAVVMAAVLIGGAVAGRSYNPLNALGLAALMLLAIRPTFLFDVGFQLSFAAVGGIVLLLPRFEAATPQGWRNGWWRRQLFSLIAVSLAATLATAPVVLFHFGQLPLAGLVLNVLAIPLTTLGMSASVLAVLVHPVPVVGSAFGAAADMLMAMLMEVARHGSAWLDFALVRGYVRSGIVIGALVASVLALAAWPHPRVRWRLFILSLLLLLIGAGQGWLREERLEVIFFDVGHGDAALVAFPGGKTLLVDAGGRDAYSDRGRWTLLPHLHRYGIRRLDAVVISHPHSDHLGGLPTLLRTVEIGEVWHNGQDYPSHLFAETRHLLDSLTVPDRAALAGDVLTLDAQARLYVLYPDAEARTGTAANDASVVLRLQYGQIAFLFTGDAEAEAETRLTAAYDTFLHSDVVKVAHHGSRTSSLSPFVEKTGATVAIVSVGTGTRYGLPDEEIVERWQQTGAAVHLTVNEGAVWLVSDGRRVWQKRWKHAPPWIRTIRGDADE